MAKKMYIGVSGVARKIKKPYIGVHQDEETTPHGLPTGYTELEYIKVNGAQAIDTGFKPNQNTKIEISYRCSLTTENTIFGCDSGWTSNGFAVGMNYVEFGSSVQFWDLFGTETVTIVFDKGKLYKNGSLLGTSTGTFQCANNLHLFSLNRNGTIQEFFTGDFLSCRIWDNGTLIRNYVTCKNTKGVVCLRELVNGKDYENTGTGTFTAGTVISTSIPEGEYARKVIKGYIGVNGVARQFYSEGNPISTLAVGTTVKMNVNGTLTDFIIVHQGIPSSLYDASCDGTWLLMKNVYEKRMWDSTNNSYKDSDIHTYLNGTFVNLFDSGIQSVIKQVKIPYHNGTGSSGSIASGSSGLSTKIFLLGAYELGWTTSNNNQIPVDGACLNYFSGLSATHSKRIGYYNGVATIWWLRSPSKGSTTYPWYVMANGNFSSTGMNVSNGVRPALILPFDTVVTDDFLVKA